MVHDVKNEIEMMHTRILNAENVVMFVCVVARKIWGCNGVVNIFVIMMCMGLDDIVRYGSYWLGFNIVSNEDDRIEIGVWIGKYIDWDKEMSWIRDIMMIY